MSDAFTDQDTRTEKRIQHFSNIKEDENSCIVDLEISERKKPRKRLRVFSIFFISVFFLGFLFSQTVAFVTLSTPPTKLSETLTPHYSTLYSQNSDFLDYASSDNGGKVFKFLSTSQHADSNSINHLISDNNSPGKCWNFEGSQATAAIKLFRTVSLQGFTLKHINSVDYSSAPRSFRVYSLNESVKTFHGAYELDLTVDHETRHSQGVYQCTHNCRAATDMVLLEITSNYGSDNTCVYQFKVHGVPV